MGIRAVGLVTEAPSHEGAFGRTIELQVDREKAKA